MALFVARTGRVRRARGVVTSLAVCLVASVAAVLAPAATAPAGAAAAGKLDYVILTTSTLHVHSSTHHSLLVKVQASTSTAEPSQENYAFVEILTPNGHEAHRWTFKIPTSALTRTSTGVNLVMHNAQLAPYGLLKLAAKAVGNSRTSTCGDGDYTVIQPVSVTGRFFFNTRSTGRQRWGGIGSKTKNVTFGTKSLMETGFGTGGLDCNDYATPCSNGPELTVFGTATVITAQTIGKKTTIAFLGGGTLSKPKGATRLDEVSTTANRPKIIISTGKPVGSATLSLTVPKSSAATGSFQLLSHGGFTTTTDLCNRHGAHSSQQDKAWNSASYIDGTPHISVPEQIFGRLGLSKSLALEPASFRILSPVS